eukprot:Amastigsp_a841303_17.p5 type:complete len:124 gc:universal Amastigsp_a841303_17:1401-1772(+)
MNCTPAESERSTDSLKAHPPEFGNDNGARRVATAKWRRRTATEKASDAAWASESPRADEAWRAKRRPSSLPDSATRFKRNASKIAAPPATSAQLSKRCQATSAWELVAASHNVSKCAAAEGSE